MSGAANGRLRWTGLIFALAIVGLAARLAWLQIYRADHYTVRAEKQQVREVVIPALRGTILDRKLKPIAVSVPVQSVYLDPSEIDPQNVSYVVQRLADITGCQPSQLQAKIVGRPESRFAWVKRRLNDYETQRVQALARDPRCAGIYLRREFRRSYPYGPIFSHTVGFTDIDNMGIEGAEKFFNSQLTGRDGVRVVEKDGLNKMLVTTRTVEHPPVEGRNLVLTLDVRIQSFVRDAIQKTWEKYHPISVTGIVLETSSAEVLAMVNLPDYDPNSPGEAEPATRKNHAVVSIYEPGSTFKPFVAAFALQRGLLTTDSTIYCENGLFRAPGRVLHDHHPYGTLTFTEIIGKSSNIGIAKVGLLLGPEWVYRAARAFGFGSRTGIELPGELSGVLRAPSRWSKLTVTSIPMGQELAVTPLQLGAGFNCFANGGVYLRPKIFRAFVDGDGKLLTMTRRADYGPRVLTPRTAARMIDPVMISVVSESGTGKAAILDRWTLFGKTGTAQKADPATHLYSHDNFISSFVCSGPASNPQVTVLVLVDQPDRKIGYYGGTVAAPAASEILDKTLEYLQVPPDKAMEVAAKE